MQFPIAEAFIEVEAADLMRYKACALFDADKPCGAEANMAKYLAAKASWEAGNACIQFHGGFGFACEYDIERKFRETRLYQVAPISTNLILSYIAEHVLGMPIFLKQGKDLFMDLDIDHLRGWIGKESAAAKCCHRLWSSGSTPH